MKSTLATVLTDRGQISIPVSIRKKAKLTAGQRLLWRQTAPGCFSVTVEDNPRKRLKAIDVIGFAQRFFPNGMPRGTDEVMRQLRQGEE